MSVEKMEKYKEYKANRKEILRREKRKKQIAKVVSRGIVVVLICVIGISIYHGVKEKNKKKYVTFVNWDKYIQKQIEPNTSDEGAKEENEESADNQEAETTKDTTNSSDN